MFGIIAFAANNAKASFATNVDVKIEFGINFNSSYNNIL
jgi:hypothetical protein